MNYTLRLTGEEFNRILGALLIMERLAKKRGDAMTQLHTAQLYEKISQVKPDDSIQLARDVVHHTLSTLNEFERRQNDG